VAKAMRSVEAYAHRIRVRVGVEGNGVNAYRLRNDVECVPQIAAYSELPRPRTRQDSALVELGWQVVSVRGSLRITRPAKQNTWCVSRLKRIRGAWLEKQRTP
jgi:hypothetical protein